VLAEFGILCKLTIASSALEVLLDQGQTEGVVGKVGLLVCGKMTHQLLAEAALVTSVVEDCLTPDYKACAKELCLPAFKVGQLVERAQTFTDALPKVCPEMSEKIILADWPETECTLRIFTIDEAQ